VILPEGFAAPADFSFATPAGFFVVLVMLPATLSSAWQHESLSVRPMLDLLFICWNTSPQPEAPSASGV
jgi:hypothetical protein